MHCTKSIEQQEGSVAEASTAAILLAAGQSVRFGKEHKIATAVRGKALGHYAAKRLAAIPFAARFVVTSNSTLQWPHFQALINNRPEDGIARSIALGIAAAHKRGVEAALIALADMPFVPIVHFQRLLAQYKGTGTLVASGVDGSRMPPALFGAEWFEMLQQLNGDQGARSLISRATLVVARPEDLVDIDSPADLERSMKHFDW